MKVSACCRIELCKGQICLDFPGTKGDPRTTSPAHDHTPQNFVRARIKTHAPSCQSFPSNMASAQHTAAYLYANDEQLKNLDRKKYATLASDEVIEKFKTG